jgi:thiamine monophosphate synthase
MAKTMMRKLRRFAEQTRNGTMLYGESFGGVKLTDLAGIDLEQWLEKNKYDQQLYQEGKRLIETVKNYNILLMGENSSRGRRL